MNTLKHAVMVVTMIVLVLIVEAFGMNTEDE